MATWHRPNAPARQLDTLHGQASRSRRPNGESHERPLEFAFSDFLLIENPPFTGKSVDTRPSAQFASRSVVATLDPIVPESMRYGSEQCFVGFFRVVESDAQQANHAAPKAAGESSRQPRPALRTHRRANRLCLH